MKKIFATLLLLATLALIACTSSAPTSSPAPTTAPAPAPQAPKVTGTVTVFAASSLTEAFNDAKAAFEAANPGATVTFNFAGSSALRTQLEQGAKADVFASADEVQMGMAVTNGVIDGAATHFATNRLVVITPVDKKIASLADLAKPGLKLVVAAPEVPVGNYARQSFASMNGKLGLTANFSTKVLANVVSNETNVRQVVGKVSLGEADAGIVYTTDVTADVQAKLATLAIPTEVNVLAIYPIATVKGAVNAAAARAFISFLGSAQGQAILAKRGFGAAP
ncbi:MAG: molybdate ABC transporter substrate-binding protein [Dehalococcoidia bacterium]|nr:molybdate ABC transporter substrate-binding protein [Dehalococcoidia bacterium]